MKTLIENAQRYYNELAPHVKERKGAFYIKGLLNEIVKLKTKLKEGEKHEQE